MIRPLPHHPLPDLFMDREDRPGSFPILDRAFDAVERALARLGIQDPATLRSPRPVEDILSRNALPEGTLLVFSPSELRAAEVDIEDTVKDERLPGSVFVSLPPEKDLATRARGLRELATSCQTYGFNGSLRPTPSARLGKIRQVPMPLSLRGYRFLLADTAGFRVVVVARSIPGGGFVGLWSGNPQVIDEVRQVLGEAASASGHEVLEAAAAVPELEGIEQERDVWDRAADLRAHRVVREAELREIARAAALRGVALRREREATRRAAAS